MDKKQVILGTIIWLLLGGISKQDPVAKTARKKILQATKKQLAVYRVNDPVEYLKLVNLAYEIIQLAYDNMNLSEVSRNKLNKITPSGLLDNIERKDPGVLDIFMYDDKHRDVLRAAYEDSNLNFPTMMYVNRIYNEIDNALDRAKSMTNDELKDKLVNILPNDKHIESKLKILNKGSNDE